MLSPDLFNRYVDDLAEELENDGFSAFFYADDLAVIVHGELRLKRTVTLVQNCCNRNHMSLNKAKCGAMFLCPGISTLTADE